MDKVIKWLGIGLLILSVLSFFICLITENSYIKFFYIPFKDILNIAIVVLAVYYFVEYKNLLHLILSQNSYNLNLLISS